MIRIRNIYYMLAYAFQTLRGQEYCDVATEEFENTAELFAAILARGISSQLRRGLGRDYTDRTEVTSLLRGRIDMSESVRSRSMLRRQMVCTYDEFSEDTPMNRVVKSTVMLLLRSGITKARKKELRRLMAYFANVSAVDLGAVDWDFRYDRNNQTYRMLLSVCWLVEKGLLQTQADGTARLMGFLDEQRMSRLYEKFILEYYRKEHSELAADASYVSWALDDDVSDMLPAMKTDVTLSRGNTVLIIDAKYYAHTTQQQYDVNTIHSGNLYQIFSYVKNKEAELADQDHEVSGMLLYAKTDEDVLPSGAYRMSGNRISVGTLDLDADFTKMTGQLDAIAGQYFAKQSANVMR